MAVISNKDLVFVRANHDYACRLLSHKQFALSNCRRVIRSVNGIAIISDLGRMPSCLLHIQTMSIGTLSCLEKWYIVPQMIDPRGFQ